MKRTTFNIKEVTEELELPYGRNTLLKKLRAIGVFEDDNTPTWTILNKGYFVTSEKYCPYNSKSDTVTLVTLDGLEFIKSLFERKILN